MIYVVKIGDKEYEVEVERGKANIIKTEMSPEPVKAISPPVSAADTPSVPNTPEVPAQGELIKSPMPGTIIDIKVSTGASVKKGDVLVILEAMKMENELAAPVDGTIAQVFVAKGASVATDDILISIQ